MKFTVHSEPVAWPKARHGTASSFKNGCRCEPCREAGAAANHAYRNRYKRKSQATGDVASVFSPVDVASLVLTTRTEAGSLVSSLSASDRSTQARGVDGGIGISSAADVGAAVSVMEGGGGPSVGNADIARQAGEMAGGLGPSMTNAGMN